MLISVVGMSGTKCTNEQKAITPRLFKPSYCSCALDFYSIRTIYLHSFLLILGDTCCSFRVMSRTKFKVEKWTKGNNSKIKSELQFVCTVYLLNDIDLPKKVNVDISCSFRVMHWTRTCGQTDIRTDKTATIIMLSLRGALKANWQRDAYVVRFSPIMKLIIKILL